MTKFINRYIHTHTHTHAYTHIHIYPCTFTGEEPIGDQDARLSFGKFSVAEYFCIRCSTWTRNIQNTFYICNIFWKSSIHHHPFVQKMVTCKFPNVKYSHKLQSLNFPSRVTECFLIEQHVHVCTCTTYYIHVKTHIMSTFSSMCMCHPLFKRLLQVLPQNSPPPALISYLWSNFFPAAMAACLALWNWTLRAKDDLTAPKEPNSHEGIRDQGFNWNRSRMAFARPRPTCASQGKTGRERVYDMKKAKIIIYYDNEKYILHLSA